jgi:hypothetical protein
MPGYSQAEAGYVIVRHFFHWPGRIKGMLETGKPTIAVIKGGICRKDRNYDSKKRIASKLMLVSRVRCHLEE